MKRNAFILSAVVCLSALIAAALAQQSSTPPSTTSSVASPGVVQPGNASGVSTTQPAAGENTTPAATEGATTNTAGGAPVVSQPGTTSGVPSTNAASAADWPNNRNLDKLQKELQKKDEELKKALRRLDRLQSELKVPFSQDPLRALRFLESQQKRSVDGLLDQWKAAEQESERDKIKEEMRGILKKQFQDRLGDQEKEIEQLEAKVKRLREQLELRRQKQDEIVDFRLQQLLREAEGLGWGMEDAKRGQSFTPSYPRAVPAGSFSR